MTEPPDRVEHNTQTIAELHARAEQGVSRHQRHVETLTATLGRPAFLYGLLCLVGLWIGLNLFLPVLHRRPFDPPPFGWLQGLIGAMSLFLTTTVLITQNRLGKTAERRALLDLHVNLLAEQKAAKLIALVEELRRDLPQVLDRRDPQAEAMSVPMDAHAAVATLEKQIEDQAGQSLEQQVIDETGEAPGVVG
jgi:uncharacterized membrane protein